MPARIRALSRIEHRLFKSTGIKEIERDVKPEEWRNKRVPPYCGRVMPDRSSDVGSFSPCRNASRRIIAGVDIRYHFDVGVSSMTSTLRDATEMMREMIAHLICSQSHSGRQKTF